ncbi:MAG TPA: hypothetical protein ENG51_15885, partial [Deltaproteobacteria bacterium]|nr:hypothetical protein [Deltaproteobacteria bacterium]
MRSTEGIVMVKGDFRSKRYKLPPEAFAIAPKEEPEPTDLVDHDTWRSLVWLADDVSLRTSEHHGTLLRRASQFLEHWCLLVIDLQSLVTNPQDDPLSLTCLNAHNDFQAFLHLILTGFYRQAIASLRIAMEAVLTGAYFRLFPDPNKFQFWADGYREGQIWMKTIRDKLKQHKRCRRFEQGEHPLLGKNGWVDFLYSRLSAFNHGRPFYTDQQGHQLPTSNVELWGGSNGPVYEPRS